MHSKRFAESALGPIPWTVVLIVWGIAAGAIHAEPVGGRWTRLGAPAGIDRAAALALDDVGERLAVGGERGVAWGPVSGPLERVLSRGPVSDLAFLPDGALLAGTDAGLYRIEGPGEVVAERIGTGEKAREVRDLDAAGGRVVAATAAGVFARTEDTSVAWRRVSELPFGEASRVALLPDSAGGASFWAVIDGALWTASPGRQGQRIALPNAAQGEAGVLALARGADGALFVVLPRSIAVREASGKWRTERLVLPPGATPMRINAEPGRLWLATDAGLLTASGPAGPWRRAGPPAGHVAVSAGTGSGARLVVATAHGLLRHVGGATVVAHDAASTSSVALARSGDPPVTHVQQRALRYLELEPHRMQRLWRGAGRSGLYPELSVHGDYDRGRDRTFDYDQSFVSGEMRHLYDRDTSRDEEYGVSLELSWDLGVAVFNPEHVDISREARLVAQLRDDVLDEINQLYFERQRVLASLDAPPPDTSPALLQLRAAELASGLDAWTGGWFSAQMSGGPDFPEQESTP
jgi:hypothetical protein